MSRNLLLENTPKKTQNEIITSLPSDIQLPFPPLIGASDFILKRSAEKIWMKSPNAFFIYRKAFQNHLKFLNYKLTMMNVSKLVSSCWKNEKVEVKDAYKKIAKEVEKQLKEKRKMDNGYPVVWKNDKKPSKQKLLQQQQRINSSNSNNNNNNDNNNKQNLDHNTQSTKFVYNDNRFNNSNNNNNSDFINNNFINHNEYSTYAVNCEMFNPQSFVTHDYFPIIATTTTLPNTNIFQHNNFSHSDFTFGHNLTSMYNNEDDNISNVNLVGPILITNNINNHHDDNFVNIQNNGNIFEPSNFIKSSIH